LLLLADEPLITWVHYLPIITTIICVVFATQLFWRCYHRSTSLHLWWWAIGVVAYGSGTAIESVITVSGNSVALTKAWYIAGALLGAYPLSQGTVFLLLKRRTAWLLTCLTLPVALALIALVLASPVDVSVLEPHRPSGAILEWQWLRSYTPILNLYAAIFLIGGAIVSTIHYQGSTVHGDGARATGNSFIALGAIIPGIGGGMAKAGFVEALYVAEMVGITFIWLGYWICVTAPTTPKHNVPNNKETPA
jgi:hypothetical protein